MALTLLSIDFLWKGFFIMEDLTDFHNCSCWILLLTLDTFRACHRYCSVWATWTGKRKQTPTLGHSRCGNKSIRESSVGQLWLYTALAQGGFSVRTSSCECRFVADGAPLIMRYHLVSCKVLLLVQGFSLIARISSFSWFLLFSFQKVLKSFPVSNIDLMPVFVLIQNLLEEYHAN